MNKSTLHPPSFWIKVRYYNSNGNVLSTQDHQVWDAAKFMDARFKECRENLEKKDLDDETITQCQLV